MDTTVLATQLSTLQADDGTLRQRLADLDAKLNRWLATVDTAQATLRSLARFGPPAREAPTAPAVTVATPIRAAAAATTVSDATEATTVPLAAPAVESSSDEELLAGVEPHVAHAIRVKRRLSGGTRSVRELLEEYRGTPAQEPTKTAERRGWWRRKNG